MEKNYYEDYSAGDTFRSPGRTITETDIVLFSSITGDWWEGHTNVEFAKETMFGQRIAHALLTLCKGMLTYEIRVFNQRGQKVLVYLQKVLVKRQAVE